MNQQLKNCQEIVEASMTSSIVSGEKACINNETIERLNDWTSMVELVVYWPTVSVSHIDWPLSCQTRIPYSFDVDDDVIRIAIYTMLSL